MLSEQPGGGLSESRKMTKSTMEKKRRARINNSLTELKAILSGMISNKGERFDKMEKADILEMTVKCVRHLCRQATNRGDSSRSASSPIDEDYRSGMHTCMSEVIKFIRSCNFSDADPEAKTKLLHNLTNKLKNYTLQKGNADQQLPYSYQNENAPEMGSTIPNVTNFDTDSLSISDLSNDSNNNLQTLHDKSTPFVTTFRPQSLPSLTPSILSSPMSSPNKSIMPVQETQQQPQNVPTVPLTILVPANLCSATLGTTCVIPLNLPTGSPQLGQGDVFQAVSQPQTSFTINSNSGISLIQTPNLVQNAPSPSKIDNCSVISPQNRLNKFTPTILSNCNGNQIQNNTPIETASKPSSVQFYKTLYSGDRKETTSSNLSQSSEVLQKSHRNTKVNEFTRTPQQAIPHNSNTDFVSVALQNPFKESTMEIFNQTTRDKVYHNKRIVDHDLLHETDRSGHNIKGNYSGITSGTVRPENISFMYNRNLGNGCDNASDMWRPWKSAM